MPNNNHRLPPNSPEAEQGVLGCVLLSAGCLPEVLARLPNSGAFYDLRHRTIFETMVSMRRAGTAIDTVTLFQRLKDDGELDRVGGMEFISGLPDKVPSAANLPHYLELMAEKDRLRRIVATCHNTLERVYEFTGTAAELWESIQREVRLADGRVNASVGGTFDFEMLASYDVGSDSNAVLGPTGRFLCRGGSAWLIGPSGLGKSSLALQMAMYWAVGRPLFGIAPIGALRVLVVQAENDVGDVAEMIQGIEQGMGLRAFDEETLETRQLLQRNLLVRTEGTRVRESFCDWLRREIEAHQAQLVIIDPLLSFAGIDVSKQDQCSQFLRSWLNPVLKDTGCALIGVHHTAKPKKSNGGPPSSEYDAIYEGLGSSELGNWARAVMVLRPCGENVYELKLPKRGTRAGAIHPDGSRALRNLWLRHADGFIFWEQLAPPKEAENNQPEPKKTKSQRLAFSNLAEVLQQIPTEGISANALAKKLCAFSRKTGKSVSESCCRNAVLDLLIENGKLVFDDASENYKRGQNA